MVQSPNILGNHVIILYIYMYKKYQHIPTGLACMCIISYLVKTDLCVVLGIGEKITTDYRKTKS